MMSPPNHRPLHFPPRLAVYGLLLVVLTLMLTRTEAFQSGFRYGSPGTTDLIEYWSAAQLLRNGENPYDHDRLHQVQIEEGASLDGPIMMYNPPWLLVWLYPLLLLSFPTLAIIWLYLSMALILLGATLVWRTCVDPPARDRLGIPWMAAAAFIPVIATLYNGQMSSLVFLGAAGFWYCVCRGMDLRAGMFLALTTIKVHVVYLLWVAVLWWLVRERRWRVFLGTLIPVVPAVALLALFWPNGLLGFQDILAHPPLHYVSATLGGILRLLFFKDTPWLQYVPSLLGIIALLSFLLLRRSRLDWRHDMSPVLLVGAATTSYGWNFDYLVLMVPYLEMVGWIVERRVPVQERAVAVGGFLIITAAMLAMNLFLRQIEWYFWFPWVLALLYARARSQRVETSPEDARPHK